MSMNVFRRDTFIGRTDQYLTSALSGQAVFDPLRDYFALHQRDDTVSRLRRYHKNWRFYNGDHFGSSSRDGDYKMVVNYCRAIVNKSADWLMGKGFTIKAAEGNELVGELLTQIWRDNKMKQTAWRAAMVGGVTGDASFLVSVPFFDEYGRPIDPRNRNIKIQAVNSSYVHPKFASSEDRTVVEVLIQYPIDSRSYASILGTKPARDLALYSQYVNAFQIREFINETEMPGSPRPNLLGVVPLVHIQNMPHPGFFGLSDLDDIIPLNEEFNEISESIRKVIKYHAEPTTLVFGAKVGDLQKGANKVWSNLPIDARVENLGLDANLIEANNHKEAVKLAIHELSSTPEQSLGKIQPISNTSNAALETAYMPLIEKTQRKRITYGIGIEQVNKLVIATLQVFFGVDFRQLAGNMQRLGETTVEFPSPLTQDDSLLIREEIDKLDHNLQSEAGALRRIYGETNTTRAIEILADKREKLLRDNEALAGVNGQVPNLAVHSTGSLALTPGVAEAFEAQDRMMDEVVKKRAELDAINAELDESANEEEEPPAENPKKKGQK